MASGGTNDFDNVKRAINRLLDSVLFVAAAGNLPACTRVTFPARMRSKVMCIFAATASDKELEGPQPSAAEPQIQFRNPWGGSPV